MYLPILTYHRLVTGAPNKATDPHRIAVSQKQFRSQLRFLKRLSFRTVRLEDYVADLRRGRAPAKRTFAITFDDGYKDVLTLALPILKEFNFTATVFAVADELDGTNRWDHGTERLLSIEDYRELREAGMTVGAHSCRHPHLSKIESWDSEKEIKESKRKLETLLANPVNLFAYPYGEYDETVERHAEEAGFQAAFATDRAPVDHAGHFYRLRRSVIFPRNTVWEVFIKAQTWYPVYQDWKRKRAELKNN